MEILTACLMNVCMVVKIQQATRWMKSSAEVRMESGLEPHSQACFLSENV